MNQGVARVSCNCVHTQQDFLYGKGVRVANATQKGSDKTTDVRCTVCSKIHSVSKDKVK